MGGAPGGAQAARPVTDPGSTRGGTSMVTGLTSQGPGRGQGRCYSGRQDIDHAIAGTGVRRVVQIRTICR